MSSLIMLLRSQRIAYVIALISGYMVAVMGSHVEPFLRSHNETVYPAGLTAARLRVATADDRITLYAPHVRWQDRSNLIVFDHVLSAAQDQAADLVVLPDGFPLPHPIDLDSEELAKLETRLNGIGCYTVLTIRQRIADDACLPTALLYDRSGKRIGQYEKTHRMPDESVSLGDDLPVFDLDFGKLAIKIGTDAHFPEIDFIYRQRGADVVAWPTSPFPVEEPWYWQTTQAARAIDNGFFVVVAGYGHQDNSRTNFIRYACTGQTPSRASIISPSGLTLSQSGCDTTAASASIARAQLTQHAVWSKDSPRDAHFHALANDYQPAAAPAAARQVTISAIHQSLDSVPSRGFSWTLEQLELAAARKSDIVLMYEFSEPLAAQLVQCCEMARKHGMSIVVAAPTDPTGSDVQALWIDRQGSVAGRYHKFTQSNLAGELPVFDTDIGRIAIRVCSDKAYPEIDRIYALQGVDIVFNPDQSWGPNAEVLKQYEQGRALDNSFFYVKTTHAASAFQHRSRVIDRFGVVVAASQSEAGTLTATVNLNEQPPHYSWSANSNEQLAQSVYRRIRGSQQPWQSLTTPAVKETLRNAIFRSRRTDIYRRFWPANQDPLPRRS